jgi:hypothetical protein
MTDGHRHEHDHHHDHPGTVHPPDPLHPSILRLSAVERLALAAGLLAVMWLAVVWAMR